VTAPLPQAQLAETRLLNLLHFQTVIASKAARMVLAAPGKQLVFVRYFSTHEYREWIHNAAAIDSARVVWALEMTPGENAKLKGYYPDRTVWLMEPDAVPPKLVPYPASSGPFLTVE